MRILALDTCFSRCSVIITENEQVLANLRLQEENKHAERLVLLIEECLQSAGIGYHDIDLAAITLGPGSFTGTRAGFAVLHGLSVVLNIRYAGFTTLNVLAHQLAVSEEFFYITAPAGRERYYCQLFNKKLQHMSDITLKNKEELLKLQYPVHGSFAHECTIDASVIARLAINNPQLSSATVPRPLYISSMLW